jgi:hypothetical protein
MSGSVGGGVGRTHHPPIPIRGGEGLHLPGGSWGFACRASSSSSWRLTQPRAILPAGALQEDWGHGRSARIVFTVAPLRQFPNSTLAGVLCGEKVGVKWKISSSRLFVGLDR